MFDHLLNDQLSSRALELVKRAPPGTSPGARSRPARRRAAAFAGRRTRRGGGGTSANLLEVARDRLGPRVRRGPAQLAPRARAQVPAPPAAAAARPPVCLCAEQRGGCASGWSGRLTVPF